MSRSYCKVLEYKEVEVIKSFRNQNRLCIHQEMRNPDYGDIIFPDYKECVYCPSRGHKPPVSEKEIRDKYFLQIRNILNGYYQKWWKTCWSRDADSQENFTEAYNCIKRGESPSRFDWLNSKGENQSRFDWLNPKKVKRIIKNWTGEPLKVFKYLTDNGFIEEAVRQRYKVTTIK